MWLNVPSTLTTLNINTQTNTDNIATLNTIVLGHTGYITTLQTQMTAVQTLATTTAASVAATAKLELANALEALYSNSKKLESQPIGTE